MRIGTLLFLLLIGAATSPTVRAEEVVCTAALGAVTVDNLRVPANSSCTLTGTQVQGTVNVENGATLNASNINVIGNIQAEGATVVNVTTNSTVGGSIQVKQGGAATVDRVSVTGDIQFEANGGALAAANNTVGGSVQVFQNLGGVLIADNVINGNLQCKENNPAPTGGNNIVQGNKEDQCVQLSGSVIYLSVIIW